jgi:hypothetical protein
VQPARSLVTPGKALTLLAFAVLAVHTAWLIRFSYEHGAFANDDLRSFWHSRTKPFWNFVLNPIDDHFVPLHRIVCWAIDRTTPMNFEIAMAIMGALHVGTLFVLWRTLGLLVPGPASAVLTCLYGIHACLVSPFLWWTAGLGRLGCIFFCTAALYYYVRFRDGGVRRDLVLSALAAAAALGFYGKGVLLPLFAFGIELALIMTEEGTRVTRKSFAAAAYLPAILVYLVAWKVQTPVALQKTNVDPFFHVQFIGIALPLFAANCLGFWLDARPAAAALAAGVWLWAIGYSTWKVRGAAVAWGVLAASVAISMSVVAMSAVRTKFFGASLARLDRYYFDAMFLVPILVAVAFRAVRPGAAVVRFSEPRGRRWGLVAVATLALAFVSSEARASYQRIQAEHGELRPSGMLKRAASYYVLHDYTRVFLRRLGAELSRIPPKQRAPLELVDTSVPWYVVPYGDVVTHNSELLSLLGQPVRVRADARWVVGPLGHVFDAGAWRRGVFTSPRKARARVETPEEADALLRNDLVPLPAAALVPTPPSNRCNARMIDTCALDLVSEKRAPAVTVVNRGSAVRLLGWAADGSSGTVPRIVALELASDKASFQAHAFRITPRPDVAAVLGAPVLVDSAFDASLKFDAVPPGVYALNVVQVNDRAETVVCDTRRKFQVR